MTGAEVFLFGPRRELDTCRDRARAQLYLEPWALEQTELIVSSSGAVLAGRADGQRVVLSEVQSAPAGLGALRRALSEWLDLDATDDTPVSTLVDAAVTRLGFSD